MSTANGAAPDGVSSKNNTVPAIPSPALNGNNSFDHSRKPSMTVTPAGVTGFPANGGPVGGSKVSGIQFGSANAGASPALGTPSLARQSSNNLGANLNPRMSSPQNSPSPIPQPASVSGGRPPSSFQGSGNGLSFGQLSSDPNDPNVGIYSSSSRCSTNFAQGLVRPMSQLQFGPQQDHIRRGSSQSVHSDMGNPGLPTGPTRGGYPGQGGRGRGYNQPYQQQMSYSPNHTFRPTPSGRGQQPSFQGRQQMNNYQGSPSLAARSPAMMNATPGTPQMNQMHMMPGMHGGPNGYYVSHQPVNNREPHSHEPTRGKGNRGRARGARAGGRGVGRGARQSNTAPSRDPASNNYVGPALDPALANPVFFPYPDLSPESGNFEHFLTARSQGFPIQTQADPSIQMMYQQHFYQQPGMQGQYQGYMPPQSPRPPYQQGNFAPQMQPTYSHQGQHPPSMSRESSQMSVPDRPGSSIGQTPTPSVSTPAPARTPSMSQPSKSSFVVPAKKSNAIVIKNASGEVVNFNKAPASPAVAAPSSVNVPTPPTPTPPSRTGSAVDAATKADPAPVKDTSAEDKKRAMQEAVARKVAEDEAKLKRAKDEVEQKAQMDKEAAEAAAREAEQKQAEAERLQKEAEEAEARKAQEAEATKAQEAEAEAKRAQEAEAKKAQEAEAKKSQEAEAKKAQEAEAKEAEEAQKAAEPTASAQAADDEIDYDAIEAEMAAIEAEEARKEAEYQKKRQEQKDAQRKKEEEEAAAYEANMKEMERKAEEAELAREKEKAEGSGDESAKKIFESLKSHDGPTHDGLTPSTEGSPVQTPAENDTATPDVSMPPPARGMGPGKRGKATELTLDTKKPVEPPEPSATLKSLTTAKRLEDPTRVSYPDGIASPNPALNEKAPADRRFKYDKEFLLQFQSIFKEKPSLEWDSKIRDALGDGDSATSARAPTSARTVSGMGPRNASNRGGGAGGAFTPMGAFGGGGASGPRTLPAGTTSAERFAAANAQMRGAPAANPFAQFGRGNMGAPMAKAPSNNPMGNMPGSPRGPPGAGRGGSRAESKRNKHGGKAMAEEKSMPLTAGMSLGPLEVSSSGWKPRSVGQQGNAGPGPAPGGDNLMEPDVVQRKVKAALNKMTPEKFDKIADQILEIAAQSKHESDGRTLRQVIQLTFEKATDEAHWAPMYAMFCRKMLESMSPDIKDENIKDKNSQVVTGGNLFRKYLLNRCQEEFERGWKVNLPGKPEGQSDEAVMLSDEYYIAAAAKRRGLGLVRFIGELFKLSMLTERIMHECVKKLVDYEGLPDEAEVESLTSLLRTIGKQLDDPESKGQPRMDIYFERIKQTMELPDLPSRQRFMLLDIIDLRRSGWRSKDAEKGPKTIQQIHAEADEAARQAELQRLASQAGGRGGGGRMPMGRGDARNFSGGYGQMPPPDNSNRVGTDDLRRLGARTSRNASNTTGPSLGPPSMMGGRTNSNRRGLGPGSLLSRGAEDSNVSSRTGTPPARKETKDESSTNAFRLVLFST